MTTFEPFQMNLFRRYWYGKVLMKCGRRTFTVIVTKDAIIFWGICR